jgi:hypothetical protein
MGRGSRDISTISRSPSGLTVSEDITRRIEMNERTEHVQLSARSIKDELTIVAPTMIEMLQELAKTDAPKIIFKHEGDKYELYPAELKLLGIRNKNWKKVVLAAEKIGTKAPELFLLQSPGRLSKSQGRKLRSYWRLDVWSMSTGSSNLYPASDALMGSFAAQIETIFGELETRSKARHENANEGIAALSRLRERIT